MARTYRCDSHVEKGRSKGNVDGCYLQPRLGTTPLFPLASPIRLIAESKDGEVSYLEISTYSNHFQSVNGRAW